ncbi:hypothetical protein GJAV_G00253920 [Gymnothorax javanicus]|nr:hypothetical protein GJAV_G00253920 [Gymnothorax javanicus]
MILTRLCFLGLLACSCQAVLQVSISLSKVELSVGESKFFTCTAIGEPVSVDWFNPQGEQIVPSQRVSLHREGVRSRLTLYNVNVEDAGIYRCLATDTNGHSQEATVVLEIYQKLTFRYVQSLQEFRQGEEAKVVCDVTSSPVPIVSWFYKEQEITPEFSDRYQVLSNNTLQIEHVGVSDEGVYRCEARVEARGEIDFRDISVIVNIPPVISVPQRLFNSTAESQESVTLTCRADGAPEPEVTWERKGKRIEVSERYALKNRGTSLTVKHITQDDEGPYICHAHNKAGATQQELSLKVFVQPSISQLGNVSAVEGSSAVISCTVEGDPLPDINWRRASDGRIFRHGDKYIHAAGGFILLRLRSADGRVEVKGHHGKSTLMISSVRLEDRGRFDCEALSQIGGQQRSMYLDIQYVPVFVTNHTTFYSWEGNAVNLSCVVQSHPPAVVLWQRDQLTIGPATEGLSNTRVYKADGHSLLEVTPLSDRDFGRYDCTARNSIGTRVREFHLAQADVPSSPSLLRFGSVSQRSAIVTFSKPESHGGVPIARYLVRYRSSGSQQWREVLSQGAETMVQLSGLEPNSSYEVCVAAVNGKGQGEFSRTETLQTLAIRKPSPPLVRGQRGVGGAYRLGLFRQDDGGTPILEYIIKYRMQKQRRWVTQLVSGQSEGALLQSLQWDTPYEVEVTARNVKGLSEPTVFHFSMPRRPDITADSLFSELGLGSVAAVGVAALLLLLVVVDLSCFFLRRCGVLMCISRKLCGKKSATCSKGKELEEGKAAYLKLPLKEENGREVLRTEVMEICSRDDGGDLLEDGHA